MSDYQPPVYMPTPIVAPDYTDSGSGTTDRFRQRLSVWDFRPQCNGTFDDAIAINNALWWLWTQGGGTLWIPNYSPYGWPITYWLKSPVLLYPGIHLLGDGFPTLKLQAKANCGVVQTAFFDQLVADETTGIPAALLGGSSDCRVSGLILDGNSSQQTAVAFDEQSGLSVCGDNVLVSDCIINNTFGHGLRTFSTSRNASATETFESTLTRIQIRNTGGHGWYDYPAGAGGGGMHDLTAFDIVARTPSQNGQGLYSCFNLSSIGRYIALHGWTEATYTQGLPMPKSVYELGTADAQFIACIADGGLLWMDVNGNNNSFVGCLFEGPSGGYDSDPPTGTTMVNLTQYGNRFTNCFFNGRNTQTNDRTACFAIAPTSSTIIANCAFVNFSTTNLPIDFTQTSGGNFLSGFVNNGGGTTGNYPTTFNATPFGNDVVELYVVGQTSKFFYNRSVASNTNYIQTAPATGFTYTATEYSGGVLLVPASTLATGTIVLPPTPADGDTFQIFSSFAVTALTLSTSDGANILNAPTTVSSTSPIKLRYFASYGASGTWMIAP